MFDICEFGKWGYRIKWTHFLFKTISEARMVSPSDSLVVW